MLFERTIKGAWHFYHWIMWEAEEKGEFGQCWWGQTKVVKEKKESYDTHLQVTLKVAYHRVFWLVSGKGRRRPFCPNDKWAGLTGHFSLLRSLSLFFPFLFILSSASWFFNPSPPPTQSYDLLPPTQDRETDSIRWQIYGHRHEAKRLKTLGNAKRPTAMRGDWSSIYVYQGLTKGQLLYIYAKGDCLHFSEYCSCYPLELESLVCISL